MCLYKGVMGCVVDAGKIDVFSIIYKKKYHDLTESSNDFTVFEFKEVIDVV